MASPISTVNVDTPRSEFIADGVQRAFFCTWPIRSTADLRLYFDDNSDPETSYIVSPPNDDGGFTVTFATPPSVGTRVTLLRDMSIERQRSYGPQKQFRAAEVNAELADSVMREQETRRSLSRTLRLSTSDATVSMVLPLAADRANRFLYFDENGVPTALSRTDDSDLDFSQFPAAIPTIDDTFIFNDTNDEISVIRKATLAQLEVVLSANRHKSFFTAADAGMRGDGITDDSFAFHSHMAAASAAGGGTYTLKSQTSVGSFYLANSPRIPSNVSVIMLSPFLCAPGVWPRMQGSLAFGAGDDGFTLQTDASTSDTTLQIDTAPNGGGPVSSYWAVDDYGRIRGLLDGCTTKLQYQEFRVTAVDDDAATITLHNGVWYNYESTYAAGEFEANTGEANRSVVGKATSALLTADLELGSNLATIRSADIGKLAVGDMVTALTERTTADLVSGAESVLTDQEQFIIVSSVSGDASNTLRLHRRSGKPYLVDYKARLVKIRPVEGASLSGARMLFASAPDLDGAATPALEMELARDCMFDLCAVPNTDAYGTRGAAFTVNRSLDCGLNQCTAADAKYVDSGDGYGVAIRRSTGCWVRGGLFDAMRHSVLFQSSTDCFAHDVKAHNPRMSPFDCHGQNERSCVFYNCSADAGAQSATVDGVAPSAIIFGNTTWLGGSHQCGFVGGRISGFKSGASGAHKSVLQFHPRTTDCFVRDTEFYDIGSLWIHDDLPDFGSLVSSGHRIENCSVDGCTSPQLLDLHGRRNGGAVNSLSDIKIRNLTARNISGGILVRYIDELEIIQPDWDEVTVDASYTYAVRAEYCNDLELDGGRFKSFGRGVSLLTCTGRAVDNHFLDQVTGGTVLLDNGNNDGFEWLDNKHSGFTSSMTRTGQSLMLEYPRLAGGNTIADDDVLWLVPRFLSGRYLLYSVSGTAFRADFDFTVTTSSIDPLASSPIVDFRTGALTGTTGTDGKISISVNNSRAPYYTIEVENRTGADLRIDGSHE